MELRPPKISMNRSQSRISNTCKCHRKFPKLKNRYCNSFDRSTLKKRRLIPEFHGPSQKRKSSSSNHPFFSAQFLCFREGIHPPKKNWRNRPWIGPDDWKKDPFLSKWSLFEGLCGYVKLWGAVALCFDGACGPWHVRAARLSSCSAPVKCPTFIWAKAFGGGGFGKVRGGVSILVVFSIEKIIIIIIIIIRGSHLSKKKKTHLLGGKNRRKTFKEKCKWK